MYLRCVSCEACHHCYGIGRGSIHCLGAEEAAEEEEEGGGT